MTREELAVEFPLGPDSLPQAGVPVGRVEKFTHTTSRIFPGTARDCWIYVPVQYDAATPACVMIVQDGAEHLKPERRWHIPTVLDNLIHRGEIPVTIGVFIDPGMIVSHADGAQPRNNRSFEYDSLSDRYARFLLEEILPVVASRYNLRTDGNSRCVMGGSSGAFCAFNAAWERPEEFARVLSIVGSYTALRGGHTMAPAVRLTEAKPLRIFLQSGEADLKVFAGDWWTANLEMRSALDYAGYESQHIWARHAGHDEFHGSTIFPEALRWVWQGYPNAIGAGVNSKQPIAKVLIAGESWREVKGDYRSAEGMTTDAAGRIYFVSAKDEAIFAVGGGGEAVKFSAYAAGVTGLAGGFDGKLLGCDTHTKRIVAFDPAGNSSTLHEGIETNALSVAKNRNIYAVDAASRRIWLVTPQGGRTAFDVKLTAPSSARVTADQGQLVVSDGAGMMSWIYSIQSDGTLQNGAPFFPLHTRMGEAGRCSEVAAGAKGWVWFATPAGVQLADANGLVVGVIPMPAGAEATGIGIGGENGDELFASAGGRVYRRRIRLAESLWC